MWRLDQASRSERFYHPELDGLRFFAFFAVFVHHALPQAQTSIEQQLFPLFGQWRTAATIAGGYGVDFFFCLSAYLITELLLREYARFGVIDLKSFFIRRVLRIWPLYYLFLLLSVFVFPWIWPESALSGRQIFNFAFILANWECAFYGYPKAPIAPMWSISIEEQFYLVWPLLTRMFGPARLLHVALGLLAVALIARTLLILQGAPHPGIWSNTFARLDPIAGGIILAIMLKGRAPIMKTRIRILWAGTSLLVLSFMPLIAPVQTTPPEWILLPSYLVVSVCCVAILFSMLHPIDDAPKRTLANPALVWLGRLSYGLYVFHAFGLKLAATWIGPTAPATVKVTGKFALGFVITLLVSVVSYYALERPFLRFKTRFAKVKSRPE